MLIGPQAAGKSTVSKAVYYGKSWRDDLFAYAREAACDGDREVSLRELTRRLRERFVAVFGPTFHLKNLFLKYDFGQGISCQVTLQERFVNPDFSKGFQRRFFEVVNQSRELGASVLRRDVRFLTARELAAMDREKQLVDSRGRGSSSSRGVISSRRWNSCGQRYNA